VVEIGHAARLVREMHEWSKSVATLATFSPASRALCRRHGKRRSVR
jgi:hypothetical protein